MIIFSNYTNVCGKCLPVATFFICSTLFLSSIFQIFCVLSISISDCAKYVFHTHHRSHTPIKYTRKRKKCIPKNVVCYAIYSRQRIWNKLRRCYWLSFSYFYLLFNKYFSVCVSACVRFSFFIIFSINESTPHRVLNELIYACVCERANASAYMCVLAHIIFPSFAFVHLFIWCFEDLVLLTNRSKKATTQYSTCRYIYI